MKHQPEIKAIDEFGMTKTSFFTFQYQYGA